MDFDELFDSKREKTNQAIVVLSDRCKALEDQTMKMVAEVKTYQFLITRILVEQRELTDRVSELECVCASWVIKAEAKKRNYNGKTEE
jgi:hypothetical protein